MLSPETEVAPVSTNFGIDSRRWKVLADEAALRSDVVRLASRFGRYGYSACRSGAAGWSRGSTAGTAVRHRGAGDGVAPQDCRGASSEEGQPQVDAAHSHRQVQEGLFSRADECAARIRQVEVGIRRTNA